MIIHPCESLEINCQIAHIGGLEIGVDYPAQEEIYYWICGHAYGIHRWVCSSTWIEQLRSSINYQ
jgi:hypothetical protein